MNPTHTPAGLALSLIGDIRSLGLVSHMDAPLKNFSKRLLACIQSIDDAVIVEKYRGHEFLNLISRLNQEVAPYLLQQELPFEGSQSLRIWVIDQAHLLTSEQQSIIFRLIELFPGLPFRVIWLSNQPLQAWKDHAKTECVFLDLDAVDPAPSSELMHEDTPDPVDSAVPGDHDTQEASTTPTESPTAKSHNRLKITAVLAGASLLGTLAWMSTPEPTASTQPTSETPAAAVTPAASEAAATTEATPASALEPAATTVQEPSPAPKNKVPEGPAKTTTPARAASGHADKTLPEAARTGARWFKALPADTYVVEHGTFSNLEQAQKLKTKHKELGTARIIAARKTANSEELQFTVITGPFRSEERAKTYLSRLDWRASTRIRATDKLKPLVASAP